MNYINNWHLLIEHCKAECMESLVENNTCLKNLEMKRGKNTLSDLESPLWIQVSVYTWILKGPVMLKQAVGLFLKEHSTGSKQELVL